MNVKQGNCPPNTREYKIEAGDNFFLLAERFHTPIGVLIELNPNVNPSKLRIGQKICIPKTRYTSD